MTGKQVVIAPNGERWRVGRRWLDKPPPKPWSRRRRRRKGEDEEGTGLGLVTLLNPGDSILAGILFTLVVAAVVALCVFVLLPLFGLALELALLIGFFASGLFSRLVLRHPWTVEAVCVDRPEARVDVQVKGWGSSGRAVETLAQTIRTTGQPSALSL